MVLEFLAPILLENISLLAFLWLSYETISFVQLSKSSVSVSWIKSKEKKLSIH